MYCVECNKFFQPSPEEEKLMTTGGLPHLCPACEKERWKNKTPQEDKAPVYPGTDYRGNGQELFRVARFNAKNEEIAFVALPPKPRKAVAHVLRKKRKDDIEVFIMSEQRGQLRTIPTTRLTTNLLTYKKSGAPLVIKKIPGYWDPHTGGERIEIAQDEILETEEYDWFTRINLKDGGYLMLYYR